MAYDIDRKKTNRLFERALSAKKTRNAADMGVFLANKGIMPTGEMQGALNRRMGTTGDTGSYGGNYYQPPPVTGVARRSNISGADVNRAIDAFSAANPLGSERNTGYRGFIVGSTDTNTGKGSYAQYSYDPIPIQERAARQGDWMQQLVDRSNEQRKSDMRREVADIAKAGFTIPSAEAYQKGQGSLKRYIGGMTANDIAQVRKDVFSDIMKSYSDAGADISDPKIVEKMQSLADQQTDYIFGRSSKAKDESGFSRIKPDQFEFYAANVFDQMSPDNQESAARQIATDNPGLAEFLVNRAQKKQVSESRMSRVFPEGSRGDVYSQRFRDVGKQSILSLPPVAAARGVASGVESLYRRAANYLKQPYQR
jgi:hypothetical protein